MHHTPRKVAIFLEMSFTADWSPWNHVTGLEGHQRETKRYLEAIYTLKLRRLIAKVCCGSKEGKEIQR